MDIAQEAWLSETVVADFGPGVGYDPVAQSFFRALYAERGPITGEPLWVAAAQHQLRLAADAVLAVLADVSATVPGRQVHIEPTLCGSVVRIACDGRFSSHDGGRMTAFGPEQALLEVATTVQDLITEAWWIVWPQCPQHGRGLLAEHVGGSGHDPEWVCRSGRHVIAAVGSLSSVAISPVGLEELRPAPGAPAATA